MDVRTRILQAAAAVYADAGFRGTTTRRVAAKAGVNEITLFRHFGTKEALVQAALAATNREACSAPLGEPVDPSLEIYGWAITTFRHWHRHRHLICRVMGDLVEHPEIAPGVCEEPECQHRQLSQYLSRMRERGFTSREFDPDAAAGLLMGAVFTHAVWRDHMAEIPPAEEVIRSFVDLLLLAVGAALPAPSTAPRDS